MIQTKGIATDVRSMIETDSAAAYKRTCNTYM